MNVRGDVALTGVTGIGMGTRVRMQLNADARASTSDQRVVAATWAARLRRWIRTRVRRRAEGLTEFHADLEQAAYLRLVEIDPSRLAATDEKWVKRQLRIAIKRALRDELYHLRPDEERLDSDVVSEEDVAIEYVRVGEAANFRRNRRRRVERARG